MRGVHTINVLDLEFSVNFDSSAGIWDDNAMGRSSIKDSSIYVDCNLKDDMKAQVFMHEMVHMIGDVLSVELSENAVDSLALGIHSLLRNNSDFIKQLYPTME